MRKRVTWILYSSWFKGSILKADILSIKKSLIDINEEIGKISNCEKYDLQSAQDYLLLEEGEDTNLKVVKESLMKIN